MNGQPFSHVGANAVTLLYLHKYQLDNLRGELDQFKAAGIRHIRVWLSNDELTNEEVGDNLQAFLDFIRNNNYDIRLTVAFTDYYGGWIYANGHYPPDIRFIVKGDSLVDCPDSPTKQCLSTEWVKSGYKISYLPFVEYIVARFANEPLIFAWEVGNEIKLEKGSKNDLVQFYLTVTWVIKQLDSHHHLVTTGIASTRWADLNKLQANILYGNPSIDYITIHKHVNDYNPFSWPDLDLAKSLNKPIVLEEIGVHKDVVDDPPVRLGYVRHLYFDAYQKRIDVILQWAVQFTLDYGSGHAFYGPRDQDRIEEYKQLWRDMRHDMEESLDCSTWNNDVQGCDEHGLFDPNPGNDTQDCAYYFCSNQCRARGTSNCEAGCNQFCDPSNSETWSCSTWNNNLQGCDEHGLFDPNPGNDTQDCAYYFCSNQCKPRGTCNCQAGCSGFCR